MANPYASDNLDPFAEDFRRAPPSQSQQPQWSAPPPPAASATSHPASPGKPTSPQSGQPQFYDGPSPSVPYAQQNAPPPPPGSVSPPPMGAAQQPQQQQIDPHARALQTSKFWTMAFYQQFFDIDTKQVLLRISNTLVPLNPPDFLLDRNWHGAAGTGFSSQPGDTSEFQEEGVVLNRNPDLYGPFWICTTLWMCLAVVSNIMSKIAYERRQAVTVNGTHPPAAVWGYDFHMAMIACVTIYVYCFGMGALVWGLMKWKNLPVSLIDSVCLYGYSMFIFLLVAILCMIPVSGLQWFFVILGGCWSSAYLLINFWHVWKVALEREWFIGVVLLVFIMHMLVTMSFKFYFLNYDM